MASKPTAIEVRATERLTREACHVLAVEIEALEQHAHRLGFTETAQAINKAKNKLGWEAVYLLNKQKTSAPTQGQKEKENGV